MKKLNLVVSLPNNNSYQQEQAKAAQEAARHFGADIQLIYAGMIPLNRVDGIKLAALLK
ncbi:MAG TPA: hypothetical protein VIW67_22985 [Terriglobales bacterium]